MPAHDYEPTKAEMEEPVKVDAGEMTFEEGVQRFLRTPVEVREVSSEEWRVRRQKKPEAA